MNVSLVALTTTHWLGTGDRDRRRRRRQAEDIEEGGFWRALAKGQAPREKKENFLHLAPPLYNSLLVLAELATGSAVNSS
jgi:hypothetical protein